MKSVFLHLLQSPFHGHISKYNELQFSVCMMIFTLRCIHWKTGNAYFYVIMTIIRIDRNLMTSFVKPYSSGRFFLPKYLFIAMCLTRCLLKPSLFLHQPTFLIIFFLSAFCYVVLFKLYMSSHITSLKFLQLTSSFIKGWKV